eukprot:1192958-Prorocentrum_minimum.AAC.2
MCTVVGLQASGKRRVSCKAKRGGRDKNDQSSAPESQRTPARAVLPCGTTGGRHFVDSGAQFGKPLATLFSHLLGVQVYFVYDCANYILPDAEGGAAAAVSSCQGGHSSCGIARRSYPRLSPILFQSCWASASLSCQG